jgi:ASC-1-like (ASCH) protein
MEHLAIMKKSWGLTKKILTGKKTIESRWYKTKYPPFDRIKTGDIVYFKDSGCPVTIRTEVSGVKQFSNLTPAKVREILYEYGEKDGLGIEKLGEFFNTFRDKKYCVIIFLKNPVSIEPFSVDKKGHGSMSSWICINKIGDIKKS